MNKEQELKEMLKLYSKQDLWNRIQEKQAMIYDLEAKLAESENLTERLQQIVDKVRDKEFAGKTLVEAVNAVYEPLYKNKYDEAEELKQQLAEMNKKALALFGVLYEILEKEDPENVSSIIDYLTKHNNSAISDQY